jgi:sugar lactone lactonase YvrE
MARLYISREINMRRPTILLLTVLGLLGITPAALATEPAANVVQDYSDLKHDCPNPEGIAIDPIGNVYASSAPHIFGGSGPANICVISSSGSIRDMSIAPGASGTTNLLGMLFEPAQGLFVADAADLTSPHGRFLRVDPATGTVTTLATGFGAPNGIAQDRHRNLYVSDSFAGTITRVAPDGSSSAIWSSDPLLLPAPEFPFGANGLAFDRNQRFMYVANTSTRRILRIPVLPDGSAGPAQIFADGDTLNQRDGRQDALVRADAIMFDVLGNLYVCANVSNEIQVLSPDGSKITRITGSGEAALDFPASLVFRGRELFISNLSLQDGGTHSKVSVMTAPNPGLPLRP